MVALSREVQAFPRAIAARPRGSCSRDSAGVSSNASLAIGMDELEEPVVTGRRLLLFAGAGVSDGNACFPKRMRVSPPHPEADLLLVSSGHLERVKAGARSSRSAREPAVV